MSRPEPAEQARLWLRFAEEDLEAAQAMIRHGLPPRHACFHAQQAAEKALKALLVFEQVDFPKIHDLDVLRQLVPDGWTVRDTSADLAALTEWAVEARYPGDWPEATEADARAAVRDAGAVVEAARVDLDLRVAR
jgi:HEPN domain-containing protein